MKIISKGKPLSQIKPVRKDSKKAVILLTTLKGVTTDEALKLQRQLPDGSLKIVARGEKKDGAPTESDSQ